MKGFFAHRVPLYFYTLQNVGQKYVYRQSVFLFGVMGFGDIGPMFRKPPSWKNYFPKS